MAYNEHVTTHYYIKKLLSLASSGSKHHQSAVIIITSSKTLITSTDPCLHNSSGFSLFCSIIMLYRFEAALKLLPYVCTKDESGD